MNERMTAGQHIRAHARPHSVRNRRSRPVSEQSSSAIVPSGHNEPAAPLSRRNVIVMSTRKVHRQDCRHVVGQPGSMSLPYADDNALRLLRACQVCMPTPTQSPQEGHR